MYTYIYMSDTCIDILSNMRLCRYRYIYIYIYILAKQLRSGVFLDLRDCCLRRRKKKLGGSAEALRPFGAKFFRLQTVLKLPQGHEGSEYVLSFEIGQREDGFYSARTDTQTDRHTESPSSALVYRLSRYTH